MSTSILDLIQKETGLQYKRNTHGEWVGQCPWCGGNDRFHVWPDKGRWRCMGRENGRSGCDRHGDAIEFVREYKRMTFKAAAESVGDSHRIKGASDRRPAHPRTVMDGPNYQTGPLALPSPIWSEHAWEFVTTCQQELMEKKPKALDWLHKRALTDKTLWHTGIGYNPVEQHLDRAAWGLPPQTGDDGRPKKLWLPRGVVIPWVIGPDMWGIRIRRPVGDPRYYWIPGGTMPVLYGADGLTHGRPVVLVEGEIDALTVTQFAGDLVAAVATGSTGGARHAKWISKLELAPQVLVAYDRDDPGEKAAQWWLTLLGNARRWRVPYEGDVNSYAQSEGADVRQWVETGLGIFDHV